MRNLERNKILIYYNQYLDKDSVIDEYGNETGEYTRIFSEIQKFRICVSSAKGEKIVELFGDNIVYDKVMTTADMQCPIDEHSILWIDETDTSKAHDYIVIAVSKSINGISYAVKKVNVS